MEKSLTAALKQISEERRRTAQAAAPAPVSVPALSKHRFLALDSWRGICALLVVIYHFPADNFLSNNRFMNAGFLAVDFFFVLSGFVIASAYTTKLGTTAQIKRFVFVRFGRLYPLHLFMIAAIAAFELLRMAVPQLVGGGVPPFTGGTNLRSLVTNLLLIHGWGFESDLTWNAPSWSISTEFFAYLYFALVFGILGRALRMPVLIALIVIGPLVLVLFSPSYMDASVHYGLIRCLFGFSLGVVLYRLAGGEIGRARHAMDANGISRTAATGWSAAEIVVVALVIAFMTRFGVTPVGIASPFLFALAIYVFAHEGGLVSALLLRRPMIFLGAISYSLYMVHTFVQSRIINIVNFINRRSHLGLAGDVDVHGLTQIGLAPGKPAIGLALTFAMVATVIFAAGLTWRFIEMPALDWFRRKAKTIG